MSVNLADLREILIRARYLAANLPPELREAGAERLKAIVAKVRPLLEAQGVRIPSPEPQAEAAAPTPQIQVPDIARQLWTLAKGDPDIFQIYMKSYPNPQVQQIANNPAQLNSIMNQITNTQSIPIREQVDGVVQAPIQSSNVFGYRYDPLGKRLTVRFNEGQVYRYSNVPKAVWDYFVTYPGVAKTTGSNRWGRWWRGKERSLGATMHQLIIAGGFPYQRIK